MTIPEAISCTVPDKGSIAFWWIGQSGFVMKMPDGTAIVADPYLSDTLEKATANQPEKQHVRMMPIAFDPSELSGIDYIFISHDHRDHYDFTSVHGIIRSNPNAKVVAPKSMVAHLKADGIDNIILLDDGLSYSADAFSCMAIKAKHNEFAKSEEGYLYLSYLIHTGDLNIFFAGDTILYDGMADILRDFHVDIAFLPINGGSKTLIDKGFASNLKYYEAVDIAVESGISISIPCHYDMFTINTEQIGHYVNYANKRRIKYIVPTIGDTFFASKEDCKWTSL